MDTKPQVNAERIASFLHLDLEKILCVYVHGSRLFGTANAESDFDIIVILDGFVGPLKDEKGIGGLNFTQITDDDFDIVVYEKTYWTLLIERHIPRLLFCELIPQEMPQALKKTFSVPFRLCFPKIKRGIQVYVKKTEKLASDEWSTTQPRKSKKNLIHSLRNILFCIQLVKHRRIVDYSDGNTYFNEVMDLQVQNYADLMAWYIPKRDVLMEDLVKILSEWKEFEDQTERPKHGLFTIDFIKWRKGNLESLYLDLAITCTPHPEIPDAYTLELNHDVPTFSPVRSKVVQECCGLVLQVDKYQNWAVLSHPFQRFCLFDEDKYSTEDQKYVPQVDWHNIKVYPKPTGISTSIFFYNGKWNFSAHCGNSMYSKQLCLRHGVPHTQLTSICNKSFWSTWEKLEFKLPQETDHSFMFVFHADFEKLFCVGARSMATLKEVDHQQFALKYSWSSPKDFADLILGSNRDENAKKKPQRPSEILLKHVNRNLQISDPILYEGYVVVDTNFTRLKFKTLTYSFLMKLQIVCLFDPKPPIPKIGLEDAWSETPQVARADDESRERVAYKTSSLVEKFALLVRITYFNSQLFLHFFPEWKEWYLYIRNKMEVICEKVTKLHQSLQTEDKAVFKTTVLAQPLPLPPVIFSLQNFGQTAIQFFCDPKRVREPDSQKWIVMLLREEISQNPTAEPTPKEELPWSLHIKSDGIDYNQMLLDSLALEAEGAKQNAGLEAKKVSKQEKERNRKKIQQAKKRHNDSGQQDTKL